MLVSYQQRTILVKVCCNVTLPPTFALDFHQVLDLNVVLFGHLRVEQHSFSEKVGMGFV